jgi:hypothetical protein
MKNPDETSFLSAFFAFLIGAASMGWIAVVLPGALAIGLLPVLPVGYVTVLAIGPTFLSTYAVALLSKSRSWSGAVIGEREQSLKRFRRYMLLWILGAALTGLASSSFRLVTSETYSTVYLGTDVICLFGVIVSLWSPKGGILR